MPASLRDSPKSLDEGSKFTIHLGSFPGDLYGTSTRQLTGGEPGCATDLRLIVAPAWATSATLQGKLLAEKCTGISSGGPFNLPYKQLQLHLAELHLNFTEIRLEILRLCHRVVRKLKATSVSTNLRDCALVVIANRRSHSN